MEKNTFFEPCRSACAITLHHHCKRFGHSYTCYFYKSVKFQSTVLKIKGKSDILHVYAASLPGICKGTVKLFSIYFQDFSIQSIDSSFKHQVTENQKTEELL